MASSAPHNCAARYPSSSATATAARICRHSANISCSPNKWHRYQVVQGYWAGAGFHEATTHCGVVAGGNTFNFALSAPVYITVTTLGNLDCLSVELVNGYNHPRATSGLQTGRYWTIRGANSSGDAASGFALDMTLPASFTSDTHYKVCRRFFVLLVIVLLAIATLVCGGSFSTANIKSATLSAYESGSPEITVFEQDDFTVHCLAKLANAPDDTVVKAAWIAVAVEGVDPNTLIDETTLTSGDAELTFDLTNNQRWPVGIYKVELYLNNKLDRTLEYQIQWKSCRCVARWPQKTVSLFP